MNVAQRLLRDDAGVALPEYALVLAVLSVALLAALVVFGTTSSTALANQATRFSSLQTGP